MTHHLDDLDRANRLKAMTLASGTLHLTRTTRVTCDELDMEFDTETPVRVTWQEHENRGAHYVTVDRVEANVARFGKPAIWNQSTLLREEELHIEQTLELMLEKKRQPVEWTAADEFDSRKHEVMG